jgi:phage gp46-like protein
MSKGFGESKLRRHGVSARNFARLLAGAIRHPDLLEIKDNSSAKEYARRALCRVLMPSEADTVIDTASDQQLETLILQGLRTK